MKETPFPMKNLITIFNRKENNKRKEKKAFKDKFCPLTCRPVTASMEFLTERHLGTNCIRSFKSQWMFKVLESRCCSYHLSCIQTLPFICNPITAPGQTCSFSETHLGICIYFNMKITQSILFRYGTILLLTCLVC